ncbi:MAG: 2-dehydropantoate 2-reductase [Chloroflexi bacterium]|nr:MAG: 2-dehydropantoate 2-reductase [Chloroflexota bacterium]
MRYIIYGAGAVGGSIGGRLFEAGHDVVLIARGPHLEAIQRDGLTVGTPDGATTMRVPALARPSEIEWGPEDLVMLTVKSQHTAAALDNLAAAAGDIRVVCAQNGVANERMALRRFSRVYAMMVMLPAMHLTPGEVVMNAAPVGGILDIGCYPGGADSSCEHIARDLTEAGFDARLDRKVMRLKYGKLLENLANAVQALCGLEAAAGELVRAVRAEGIAALQAAGIDFATGSEMDQRRAQSAMKLRPIEGQGRGGSTWQSLARRAGSVETDYLNGEIALLGALHGVPTPYDRLLQRLTAEAARQERPPGSHTVEELMLQANAPIGK